MSRDKRTASRRAAPWWRRRPGWATLAVAVIVAAAVGLGVVLRRPGSANAEVQVDADVLAAGATIYADTCASCHGAAGEGFARADVPAPPLDGSAHSWHHPDDQIIGLIRRGGTLMPAVGAAWTDGEIDAVVTFVKSRWAPWQRDSQPGTLGE